MPRDAESEALARWGEAWTIPAGDAPRFPLVRFADIRLNTTRTYLVKEIVPREGLIVVWGPPKCGKTFWAFDVGMHIALGWEYRGRRVQQGAVVYIACEGERGLAARAEAFRQRKISEDDADPPFHLLATRLDLAADVDALISAIAIQIGKGDCVAIFVDTLNRSIAGSESDDKDMGAYVRAADKLREAFHGAVIIIHHCGINSARPRGHTSLTGAADAQIAVKKDAAGNITTTVEYLKDGPEGEVTTSCLSVIEVGIDDDGDIITSCVIEPADPQTLRPAPVPKAGKAPSPTALKFYEAFNIAGTQLSQPRPESSGRPSITEEQWIAELTRRVLIDPIPIEGDKATTRAANNRQTAAISKYRRELISANWLACNGKIIWSVKKENLS